MGKTSLQLRFMENAIFLSATLGKSSLQPKIHKRPDLPLNTIQCNIGFEKYSKTSITLEQNTKQNKIKKNKKNKDKNKNAFLESTAQLC